MAIMDVIRCDLPQSDYLVWKWGPHGGNPGRSNQIRWGSSLRVRTGECAAFFYSRGGGTPVIDIIDGPADLILETKNIPVIANFIGLAYGGDSPFQAEVYFINKGQATQLRWGVPWFDAFDPRFPDFPVPIALSGAITFKIEDIKRFIEIQRLDEFDPAKLTQQIRPQLTSAIKANTVTLAVARGIPLVQLGGRTEDVTTLLQPTIAKVMEQFGLAVRNFAIEGIEINKDSEGFRDLMAVTKDIQMRRLQAQSDVEVANIGRSADINATNLAETLAIQRENLQGSLGIQRNVAALQGQTQYLAAHQVNRQAEVGIAAAEGLGQMGSGGGGGGGGGMGGIGTAAIMMGAGLPIGAAFGQQLASNVNQTIAGGINRPPVPPPGYGQAPGFALHITKNGQQLGVLPIDDVNRQISVGALLPTDFGWFAGLAGWQQLHTIPGVVIPPPPPPTGT